MHYRLSVPGQAPQEIRIEIPTEAQRIGVMFSGGVDSTLILALLQIEKMKRPFDLTAFTVDNKMEYEVKAQKILRNPFFQGINHVADIPNGQRYDGIIKEGIRNVLVRPDVDLVFTGVNKLPDFEIPASPIRITPEEVQKVTKLRCPVLHLTKDFIVQAFFEIPEIRQASLLGLTHSCTNRLEGSCDQCFQCVERRWAFERIGQVDPIRL